MQITLENWKWSLARNSEPPDDIVAEYSKLYLYENVSIVYIANRTW